METAPPSQARPRLHDGYYINLDRAPERREAMERQIAALGLSPSYKRFPAIDGATLKKESPRSRGEVGIFRSHLDLIEKAARSPRPLLILEDDVILSDLAAPAIDRAISTGMLDDFDMVFLEMFVGHHVEMIRRLKSDFDRIAGSRRPGPGDFEIINLGGGYLWGATSYVISPTAAARILPYFRKAWHEGPEKPFDHVIQDLARMGRLRLGCFVPFLCTVDLDSYLNSSAGRSHDVEGAQVYGILRYSFFVDRDIERSALPLMDNIVRKQGLDAPDTHRDLIFKVLAYSLRRKPPQDPVP